MRKRSKYRPKLSVQNPIALALAKVTPLTRATDDNAILRTAARLAYTLLRAGKAGRQEIADLCDYSNAGQSLKEMGKGAEYTAELLAGADALEAVLKRKRVHGNYVCTAQQLGAIAVMLDVVDAQLDASSVYEVIAARAVTQRVLRNLEPLEVV